MNQLRAIQKILSPVLLFLFTISITPKTFFHDAIAGHRDTVVCRHPQKDAACVHQQGFHCGFDDLVVAAPYLPLADQSALPPLPVSAPRQNCFSSSSSQHNFFHAESRGPPQA